jgi:hypothetical protein
MEGGSNLGGYTDTASNVISEPETKYKSGKVKASASKTITLYRSVFAERFWVNKTPLAMINPSL